MTASSSTPTDKRQTPRWWRWRPQKRLCCAAGHPYAYTFRIHERAAHRCSHWITAEKRECGKWTYFLGIRGGGVIVVDVTVDEVNHIGQMETGTEVIDYLGIFPD